MLLSFAKCLPFERRPGCSLGLALTRDSRRGCLVILAGGDLWSSSPKAGHTNPSPSDRAGGNSLHRMLADEEFTCTLCDEATFETGTFRLLVAQ